MKQKKKKPKKPSFWKRQALEALAELGRPVPDLSERRSRKREAAMTGEQLFALRSAAGRSLTDCARAVGVSIATLSRWEAGIRSINAERAAKLLAVLSPGSAKDSTA